MNLRIAPLLLHLISVRPQAIGAGLGEQRGAARCSEVRRLAQVQSHLLAVCPWGSVVSLPVSAPHKNDHVIKIDKHAQLLRKCFLHVEAHVQVFLVLSDMETASIQSLSQVVKNATCKEMKSLARSRLRQIHLAR